MKYLLFLTVKPKEMIIWLYLDSLNIQDSFDEEEEDVEEGITTDELFNKYDALVQVNIHLIGMRIQLKLARNPDKT